MPRRLTRKFEFPVSINRLYIDIPRIARRCSLCGKTLPKDVPHYAYTKEYKSNRRKSRINVCPACVDAQQDSLQVQFRDLRAWMGRVETFNLLSTEQLRTIIHNTNPTILASPNVRGAEEPDDTLANRILKARGDPREKPCYDPVHITKKRWKSEKVDPRLKCPMGMAPEARYNLGYIAPRPTDSILNNYSDDQLHPHRLDRMEYQVDNRIRFSSDRPSIFSTRATMNVTAQISPELDRVIQEANAHPQPIQPVDRMGAVPFTPMYGESNLGIPRDPQVIPVGDVHLGAATEAEMRIVVNRLGLDYDEEQRRIQEERRDRIQDRQSAIERISQYLANESTPPIFDRDAPVPPVDTDDDE
jgi:hypothetical protein